VKRSTIYIKKTGKKYSFYSCFRLSLSNLYIKDCNLLSIIIIEGVWQTMDYNMTEDQEMFVKMVKDFGEKRLLPGITERDHNHEYDEGIVAEMLEMGLAGTYFPEEYGAAGADVLSCIMTVGELAK